MNPNTHAEDFALSPCLIDFEGTDSPEKERPLRKLSVNPVHVVGVLAHTSQDYQHPALQTVISFGQYYWWVTADVETVRAKLRGYRP